MYTEEGSGEEKRRFLKLRDFPIQNSLISKSTYMLSIPPKLFPLVMDPTSTLKNFTIHFFRPYWQIDKILRNTATHCTIRGLTCQSLVVKTQKYFSHLFSCSTLQSTLHTFQDDFWQTLLQYKVSRKTDRGSQCRNVHIPYGSISHSDG